MRSSFVATLVAVAATFSSVLAAPSLPCDVGLFKAADGSCTATCPTSTFGDAKTGTCKSCYSPSYKSCSSARVTAATACIDGYFVKGGRCMAAANIPAGSYGAADGTIVNCGKGVLKCSAAEIESCKTGYTLSNGDCVACPAASIECTSPTTATACFNNYFLSNAQCVQTCPASTFANAATASCKACYAPSYSACKNARVTSATACVSGYYLTSGRCMPETSIPKGKYGKDGKIYSCPAGQASCTAAGPTSCKTGFSLSTDGKTCEPKSACAAHSVCDSTGAVTSCTGGWSLYKGVCVQTCPSGTLTYWRGTCVDGGEDDCPIDSWYEDGDICRSCGAHATSCAYGVPNTCETGFIPGGEEGKETYKCKSGFLHDYSDAKSVCVTECKSNQRKGGLNLYPSSWYCINCVGDHVATCSDFLAKPTSCVEGYQLSPDGKSCVVKSACPDHALCDASGTVTSCNDSYRLVNGACLAPCESGQYPYWRDGTCVSTCPIDSWLLNNECAQCDPNAIECGLYNGVICKPGWVREGFNYEQTCWKPCPAGKHPTNRTDDAVCVPCSDPNTKLCFPDGTSRMCKPGFLLSYLDRSHYAALCTTSCGEGQYKSSSFYEYCYWADDVNAVTAADETGYPLTCKDGYQVSADGKSCAVSDPAAPCPNAAACDSTGAAVSCGVDWYLLNGECIRSCPLDKVTVHPVNHGSTLFGG
ncbi:hypothetical protein JCM6882_004429, partial [Rhodosporidiobolus microsporus]